MKYMVCPNCGKHIEVASADYDELGWHTSCPKCKGSFDIDIEDYLIAVGERVRTTDGKVGTIKEFRISEPHIDFDEVVYFVHFGLSGYGTFYPRHELTQPADWRLTRRDQYGVSRECHYPKNQDHSNVPCYNCSDRTKCNADIFERLAQYEDAGLLPNEIERLNKTGKPANDSKVHYVIINDWANEKCGSCDINILAVAHSEDEAKRIFSNHAQKIKNAAEEKGWMIYEDTDEEFDAGESGYYIGNHERLYIKRVCDSSAK